MINNDRLIGCGVVGTERASRAPCGCFLLYRLSYGVEEGQSLA